ncbi:MAG: FAD-binding oxidoreductase [Bryobacteraceae bacterium]|nr:FAD-binding oxidoreductase [Bryobacteraceae bacterium]
MSWGYLEDASGLSGHADRICVPRDEAELVELLRNSQAAITIAGGGSGVTAGRVPQGGWLVSMEKFRRLEIGAGVATVGAGVTLQDLHAAAKATGQFYPPDPTETLAFVGGTIACNSSGSRSFLYGATRRWVRRLRVALVDGTVLDLRRGQPIPFDVPLVPQPRAKHSCGYALAPGMDFVDLFIGSEGTLGLILEAELALLPNPPGLLNGVVMFATDDACQEALEAWRAVPGLRMLEYVDEAGLRLIAARYPTEARAALIIEQIAESDTVEAWTRRLAEAHALESQSWFGTTDADRERFRQFRHALPETALALSKRHGHPTLLTDFSVPIPRHREMLAFYRQQLDAVMPGEYCIIGHVGDAHAHVLMMPSSQARYDAGVALLPHFAAQAVSFGGSVAAEHGLGKTKAKLLALQYRAQDIEAMLAVKRRFDPDHRLGRGTLFAA